MTKNLHTLFERRKHIGETRGREFWRASELGPIFGFSEPRKFEEVISAAEGALAKKTDPSIHFHRGRNDILMSRLACYLVAKHAGVEDLLRSSARANLSELNKRLSSAAKQCGISENYDFAIFMNEGYKGLYNDMGYSEIHEAKGLKKSHHILDYMGVLELYANSSKAEQTIEALKAGGVIKDMGKACNIHFATAVKARNAFTKEMGTAPERLSVPEKSIAQVDSAIRKAEKQAAKPIPIGHK